MLPIEYFDTYLEHLKRLPLKGEGTKYSPEELKIGDLRLFSEGDLEVYYAPFHHFDPSAKLVLVGITPGFTQMEEAIRAARDGLERGLSGAALFEHIDKTGSFSGPMRRNLVSMLDEVGVAERLGVISTDALFEAGRSGAAFTSCISAPVFRRGKNYTGQRILKIPKIRDWVIRQLTAELGAANEAIVVPLGKVANTVVTRLEAAGLLHLGARFLRGFPHPSGANGHRRKHFEEGRERWRAQILR